MHANGIQFGMEVRIVGVYSGNDQHLAACVRHRTSCPEHCPVTELAVQSTAQ